MSGHGCVVFRVRLNSRGLQGSGSALAIQTAAPKKQEKKPTRDSLEGLSSAGQDGSSCTSLLQVETMAQDPLNPRP